jgi:hypothetical protein
LKPSSPSDHRVGAAADENRSAAPRRSPKRPSRSMTGSVPPNTGKRGAQRQLRARLSDNDHTHISSVSFAVGVNRLLVGAWRALPVGTVKTNAVFCGAPGEAAQPRRASGSGYGLGAELLAR